MIVVAPRDPTAPHGELWLDIDGEPHFDCESHGEDFPAVKVAFQKYIDLLQRQLDNAPQCPFYPK